MKHWVDGFAGDAHPSREMAIWERIASSYLEVVQFGLVKSDDQRRAAYKFFVGTSLASDEPVELSPELEEHRDVLEATFHQALPVFELEDAEDFPLSNDGDDEDGRPIEDFSDPLREDLARHLVDRAVSQEDEED